MRFYKTKTNRDFGLDNVVNIETNRPKKGNNSRVDEIDNEDDIDNNKEQQPTH